MNSSNQVENVIIIGGGPAGLACSVYTSRANLKPLLFAGSPPGGQLMLTSDVENYPGFESILGPELIEMMRKHVVKFGTRIVDKNVLRVNFKTRPFELYTINGQSEVKHLAHSVVITTGAKALWLGLENETRLRGKGVSACATCDGFFFKEKEVAVVGGGDTAAEEALFLTKFASKVTIIHRRDQFRASKIMQDRIFKHPKIKVIWNTVVTDVLGENKVEGIQLKTVANSQSQLKSDSNQLKQTPTDSTLKVDGLFIGIGHKPDTNIFKGQIELDKKGYIITSERFSIEYFMSKYYPEKEEPEKIARTAVQSRIEGDLDKLKSKFNNIYNTETSIHGVFAAGDCVDFVYRQAATAAGRGVAAALEVEKYLEGKQS